MKFRVFLGIICLAFITTVLAYGSNSFGSNQPAAEPTAVPTPEIVAEISESISCEVEEIPFATGPFVVGFVGRPATLLPFNPSSLGPRSQIETELSELIFRGLVQFTSTGEPIPDLASWQLSEDGLSVTFVLDQGAFWHDGIPVTAADVEFTVNALAAGDFSVPGNFPWETVTVSVIDQITVQLTLPVPYAPLLEAATVGLLPAHLGLDGLNLTDSSFATKPIGNGDFQVINQWETDGLILLEPVAPTLLENIEVRFYPSTEAMTADFANNDLDLAILPSYTPISVLSGVDGGRYNLFSAPTTQSTQLFFRMDKTGGENEAPAAPAAIEEPAVRQALRLALDRRALIAEAANGQGIPADGPWPLNSRFHDAAQFPVVPYDLAQAAAVLDEAGWLSPESDGLNFPIRQKDGVSLEVDILVLDRGINGLIAAQLAQQWAELGVRANANVVSAADYQNAIIGRQFDVTVQKIRLAHDPDLYDFWSQEAIVRGQNISRWNNRPASEALEAGRQVWAYELRKPYYNAFQAFYERELPAFTLFQDVRTVAVSSRVEGQKVGYSGDLGEFMKLFPQWYILDENLEAICADES